MRLARLGRRRLHRRWLNEEDMKETATSDQAEGAGCHQQDSQEAGEEDERDALAGGEIEHRRLASPFPRDRRAFGTCVLGHDID